MVKERGLSAAASDLFPLETTDGCWCAAVNLFHAIAVRHGDAVATRMFKSLATPSKQQRKRLQDEMLRTLCILMKRHHGWGMRRAAAHLATGAWKGQFGQSEDAVFQRIRRVNKDR